MNRLVKKVDNKAVRKHRIRAVVSGTPERPRFSVAISNRHINAQIIDDTVGVTKAYVTTVGKKGLGKTLTDKANWAGTEIAKSAKTSKVKKVVFDRAGKKYHGRIKAVAESARKAGLEF